MTVAETFVSATRIFTFSLPTKSTGRFLQIFVHNIRMRIIGYARVSTRNQNLTLQLDELEKSGCHKIFEDVGISGSTSTRPGLDAALAELNDGDKLIVWRLDRLGRSLNHLVQTVVMLKERNCQFSSLTENLDTSSASGELVFHLMAALAQFERTLIVERTQAGLTAAKRRGQKLGRPRKLSPQQIEHARDLVVTGQKSIKEVGKLFGVNRTTVWRAIK